MEYFRTMDIPLAEIEIPEDRARDADPAYVEVLAASLKRDGQKQEIVVAVREGSGLPFRLGAGHHRVKAALSIGWTHVRAAIWEASDAELEWIEATENLERNELNPLDRMAHLARAKEAYEKMHPETRNGGDRGNQHTGGKKRQNANFAFWNFSKLTAEKTGLSRRTIETAVRIYGLLDPEVRRTLRRADKLSGADLAALAEMDAEVQRAVAALILARPEVGGLRGALKEMEGGPSDDDTPAVSRLMAAWDKATPEEQAELLEMLWSEGIVARIAAPPVAELSRIHDGGAA